MGDFAPPSSVGVSAAADVTNVPAGTIAATNVQTALNELDTEKAPLASPALTGNPTVPTQTPGTNNTRAASTAYADAAVAAARVALGALPVIGGYAFEPGTNAANFVPVTDRLYLAPLFLPLAATFDRIGVRVESAGTGTLRLGIYAAAAADGSPGALLLDAGTVSVASGFADTLITISHALSAGVCWLAAQFEVSAAPTVIGATGGSPRSWSSSDAVHTGLNNGLFKANTGALPGTAGTVAVTTSVPRVVLRRSA